MPISFITHAFSALFSKPLTVMDIEGLKLILQLAGVNNMDLFLYVLISEASKVKSDPHWELLDRFVMDSIFSDAHGVPAGEN
jgi:hypothetical protein